MKTSESVSILIRAFLWEMVTFALFPVLFVAEILRSLFGYIARQIRDR